MAGKLEKRAALPIVEILTNAGISSSQDGGQDVPDQSVRALAVLEESIDLNAKLRAMLDVLERLTATSGPLSGPGALRDAIATAEARGCTIGPRAQFPVVKRGSRI